MIRSARTSDADELLRLMQDFAAVHGDAFDAARVRGALLPLLADPALGEVLVVDLGDCLEAYAVLTWGWSVESGGREALLDEIYVEDRGRGTGTRLLQAVIDAARAADARVLFLETEGPNDRARRFYTRHGFAVEPSVWLRMELGARNRPA